jgi:hypothetical protein
VHVPVRLRELHVEALLRRGIIANAAGFVQGDSRVIEGDSPVNRRDLDELVSISEWPCITVIAPLAPQAPDNAQNATRVKTLLKRVHEKLEAERVSPHDARPVLARLEGLLSSIDLFAPSALGLALFASPSFARRLDLPVPVRERVAVDRVFVTREVLVALERGVRWRAVVLGSELPRLLDAFEDRAIDTGVSDLGALMAADRLPLVVVGLESELVSFVKESPFAHDVIVTIRGRHDRTPARELGPLLWPVVREALEAVRSERVGRELDAAIKHGRLVSGIEEVWSASHQGRGALLLVEDDLHFPIVPGAGSRGLLRAPAGLEVDNAIDEIVDVVLAMGGAVEFVSPGALREHRGIALVTRYAAVRDVA